MEDIEIYKAKPGDEKILAYIQAESWKAAFAEILTAQELKRCTDLEKCKEMYQKVLEHSEISIWIEKVDKKPHCIAAWSPNRDKLGKDVAELICIHSLKEKWHQGYGTLMMRHVLGEMKKAGYVKVVLWVFEKNLRARAFYEKQEFVQAGRRQINEISEIMYLKNLVTDS